MSFTPSPYLFLDLETTGLDPDTDEIYEAAWIDPWGKEHTHLVEHKHLPSLWTLQNTDYTTRVLPAWGKQTLAFIGSQLHIAKPYQTEMYLVGANPAFDHGFLRKLFKATEHDQPYNYHLIDVEALVMEHCGLTHPPHLADCRALLGLPGSYKQHSALDDAREAKHIFEFLQHLHKVAKGEDTSVEGLFP